MLVNPLFATTPDVSNSTGWLDALAAHPAASTLASLLSAFFAMVAGIASWRQVSINSNHASSQERAVRADIFLKIADRWSQILPKRRELLNIKKIPTCKDIEAVHGKNASGFLGSPEWEDTMRPICNFYEILGVMLEQRSIDPEALFVLVTVDTVGDFEGFDKDGNAIGHVGFAIHRQLQGPIEYLRTYYRRDIYLYYDKYLLEAYLRYLGKRGFYEKHQLDACAQSLIIPRLLDRPRDQALTRKAKRLIDRCVGAPGQGWVRIPWTR